jgi:hypothetical protein
VNRDPVNRILHSIYWATEDDDLAQRACAAWLEGIHTGQPCEDPVKRVLQDARLADTNGQAIFPAGMRDRTRQMLAWVAAAMVTGVLPDELQS